MDAMKPKLRNQYPTGQRELVRAGCVTLAKLLGDDLRDHITLVGGVVPLLVVPESIQAHDPHPGTLDLDIGVAVSVAKASEALLHDRLMAGGFVRDRGEARWQYPAEAPVIWLDTIPEGGWLPEISLAFRDRDNIRLHGLDLTGTPHATELWVIGPAAYVVLKALAFDRRREPKDAFDLWWLLKNLPGAMNTTAVRMASLMGHPSVPRILATLRNDFEDDGAGPRAVAAFVTGGRSDDLEADVVGLVNQLLDLLFV